MRRAFWVQSAVTVLALLLPAAPAGAQKEKKPAAPVPIPAPFLKKLQVTPEQDKYLAAAAEAYAQAQKQARQTGQKDPAAATTYREQLGRTLSSEQQTLLQSLVTAAAREYRGLGDLSYHLATMELSADQKTKIAAAIERYVPELEQLATAAKVNKDETARNQMSEVRGRMTEEVLSALTAEQRATIPPSKKGR
jgi:hypothetical protein